MKYDLVIGKNYAINEPILGDSEIVSLYFIDNNLIINLRQYTPDNGDTIYFRIKMINCYFMNFNTDSMQNVVSDIYIADMNDNVNSFSKEKDFLMRKKMSQLKLKEGTKIVIIEPILGADMYGFCEDIEVTKIS